MGSTPLRESNLVRYEVDQVVTLLDRFGKVMGFVCMLYFLNKHVR